MSFIRRSWRGEEDLWKVFWIYNILFNFLISRLEQFLPTPIHYGWFIALLIYTIWLVVSSWRCAFNVNFTFIGYIFRFWLAISLIGLVVGGILMKDFIHDYAISYYSEETNVSDTRSCAEIMSKVLSNHKQGLAISPYENQKSIECYRRIKQELLKKNM